MRPLYQIANEYANTYETLSQIEELSSQIINDTLDGIKDEFEKKVLNIAAIIKNLEADASKIKEAEEAMSKRRKRLQNEAGHLREYLLTNLETGHFMGKVESPEHEISLGKCPPSLKIDNENRLISEISDTFLRVKRELDKVKIKEAIQNGSVIEGVSIVNNLRLILK